MQRNYHNGFTLVEMMVAVSVFSVVALIVTSSIVLFLSSSKQAAEIRALTDNIDFALNSMTFKIKFGQSYSTLAAPSSSFSFVDQGGNSVKYELASGSECQFTSANHCIAKCDGVGSCTSITAEDIDITGLTFTDTTESGFDSAPPGLGPYKTLQIKADGRALVRGKTFNFSLQTTVSKEHLD